MQRFDYVIATSLPEAAGLLPEKRGGAYAKAGGIDLIAGMKDRLFQPTRLVNLLGVEGLKGIRAEGGSLRIGALATLAELAADPAVRKGWEALAQAAEGAATPQVRNVATVAGNLCQRPRCWYFRNPDFACLKKGGKECFAAEGENQFHALFGAQACVAVHPSSLAPALVALSARVKTVGPAGGRELGIEELFQSPENDPTVENVLGPQELIAELVLPAGPERSASLEARERQSFDWPLVIAAAAGSLAGGKIADPRVCLGAVALRPWRLQPVEQALKGKTPSVKLFQEAAELAAKDAKPLAKNAYKVKLVKTLIERVLAGVFAV